MSMPVWKSPSSSSRITRKGTHMSIEQPIYAAYPNVKPLELALIAAAADQGATAEEFELACQQIKRKLAMKASGILLSELKRDM